MKKVKVISEDFDVIGGIYNLYTIEEVRRYLKDAKVDATSFEKEYDEQCDGNEEDYAPYGIVIGEDKVLGDVDLSNSYYITFVWEDEFWDIDDEYMKKYNLYKSDVGNIIFDLKEDLRDYNESIVTDTYEKFKNVLEYAEKINKILEEYGLKIK